MKFEKPNVNDNLSDIQFSIAKQNSVWLFTANKLEIKMSTDYRRDVNQIKNTHTQRHTHTLN